MLQHLFDTGEAGRRVPGLLGDDEPSRGEVYRAAAVMAAVAEACGAMDLAAMSRATELDQVAQFFEQMEPVGAKWLEPGAEDDEPEG